MIKTRSPGKSRRTFILHFLVIFAVIAVVISATLGLYAYQRFQLQQEVLEHTESLRLDLASKVVARNLQQPIIDLHLLAESQDMQDFLLDSNPGNTARLRHDFINLSKQSGIYDQIRFIDRQGQEQIRINYNNGQPTAIATKQLQNKSNRYYFQDTLRLSPGQVYISPLDLNIEKGAIELPYKPMIRFATPLPHPQDGKTAGILILNYMAGRLLSRFEESMTESWGSPMVLNRNGYWLYSPRHEDEWGFMLDKKINFATRYPLAWAAILKSDTGSVRTPEGLFTYTTIRPNVIAGLPATGVHADALIWRLLSRVNPDKLTFSLWRTMREHIEVTSWFFLATLLLSYLLTRLRTTNIEKTDALAASQERYQNLFENMEEGYALLEAVFDADGKVRDFRYLAVNPAFERILGLKRDEVVGKTIMSLIPDIEDYWIEAYVHVATTCEAAHLEQYNARFDRYFEITAACPDYGMVAVLFADVTVRKRAEEQQRQATTAFNNTMEAIMITDAEQKIMVVNQAYTRVTGYESEEVIGLTPNLHRSGRHNGEFYQQLWHTLEQSGHWQGEVWNRRKNGEIYPAWENISVVKDEQGRICNYVSVFSDISTIKQTEARLSELAHHDSLTGLSNRLAFNLNLEKALERVKRHQHKLALLYLDLDRFKLINDTLGHAAGDKLLQIISQRLLNSVRAEDVVARLGGDEFTVIMEDVAHSEDAATLAQKIIATVTEPMELDDQEIVISTSIGLSIYPDDASTATDLARAADTAMYRAKAKGRHTFEFYTSDLTDYAMQRLTTENSLRQALVRDELMLYYQPQIEVATGRLCGVEALLRWQHPEHGLLLPDKFIHIAEESQLIDLIGEWVLHKACAQARIWRDAGLPVMRIAINLSPRQIKFDNTANAMEEAFKEHNLKPSDVLFELEITENVLQSKEQISGPLRQLRQLGASIAIDDFGTGYSSLSHLKQLPIDTLKIDQAFLRNIPEDTNNTAITAAIISMGHSLGMRVVAEGIETLSQLQFLKQHACDEAQGFLFSEALPPEHLGKIFSLGKVPNKSIEFLEIEKLH